MKILKINRFENTTIFERYRLYRKQMLEKMVGQGQRCSDIANLKSTVEAVQSSGGIETTLQLESFMKTELLSQEINEHYLFHGCGAEAAKDIVEHGFDPRLANEGGMFGKGVYFAENPTKSDQYSGEYCFFVFMKIVSK